MAKRKISNAECWQCEERDVKITRLRAENAELLATLAKIAENLERAAFVQDRSVNIIKQVIWMQAKDARAAIAKHENKEG